MQCMSSIQCKYKEVASLILPDPQMGRMKGNGLR